MSYLKFSHFGFGSPPHTPLIFVGGKKTKNKRQPYALIPLSPPPLIRVLCIIKQTQNASHFSFLWGMLCIVLPCSQRIETHLFPPILSPSLCLPFERRETNATLETYHGVY